MGRKQFTHCACKGCTSCTPCTGCDRCTTLTVPLGHCSAVRGRHGARCRACTPRWWLLKSDAVQPAAPAVLNAAVLSAASFLGDSASAPEHDAHVPAVIDATLPSATTLALAVPATAVSAAQPAADSLGSTGGATHLAVRPAAATLAATSATLHVAAITLDPAPPDSAAMLNSLAAVAAMLPRAIDPNEGRKVGEG